MLILGRRPVLEALKSDQLVSKIYIQFGSHGDIIGHIKQLARRSKIPIVELSKEKFERLGNLSHAQGVAALIEDISSVDVEDILQSIPKGERAFILALDSIADPHNLGALLRSAECMGVHGVIIPKHTSAPITDAVIKASVGATVHLKIARVSNLAHTLEELKNKNIWIAGLDDKGPTNLFEFDTDIDLCIVVGNEGTGMRKLVKNLCDFIVRIPIEGKISSLNVSVAGALVMYEVRRKRRI